MKTQPSHSVNSPRTHVASAKWRSVMLLALAMIGILARAQSPTLSPAYDAYYPGEDIVFSFANGPGNPKDWIGLYPEGNEPGPVPSTRWYYVNNTQNATVGLKEGSVVFTGGLDFAGTWYAYFFLDDGYTMLATNVFYIVDPPTPLLRADHRTYATQAPITITFTNGPGNPKDWVGIYKEGQTPGGGPTSTIWAYVDGTQNGNTVKSDGTIGFAQGLSAAGNYVAYFLLNDGYDILASNAFKVVEISTQTPRLLSIAPANNASNQPPIVPLVAAITNGSSQVVSNSVVLTIDGIKVGHHFVQQADLITVSYTNSDLYAPGSAHQAVLTYSDNATPAQSFTNQVAFVVANYRNIVLPPPLYFENFDNTPEGQLPAGWTEKSYTEVQNPEIDFGNLDSAAYATWTVVNADRFKGAFIPYSNPDAPQSQKKDMQRVLSINPLVVTNGKVLGAPLAQGRFLFGDSAYRNGASQVMFAFTPDYDCSGKTNLHVSFHSLYEQNQDSIGAVEYSVDQGAHWLPVVYLLVGSVVVTTTNELTGQVSVDAVATFSTAHDDVALYSDDNGEQKGGTYGAFIAAPISQDLAPFITPRVDDDPVESKRIELFRLPQADNQSKVRFRFAYAGTDSWYFGVDDFGLYSITNAPVVRPALAIARSGANLIVSWPADVAGFTLETTEILGGPTWKPVSGVVGNAATITPGAAQAFYRLRQ